MQYLKSFSLATEQDEGNFLFSSESYPLDMACYNKHSHYPFQIFPFKQFSRLDLEPITILYGGNGSGKSTILNIMAEKLKLERTAPFNNTPLIEKYLSYCKWESCNGLRKMPRGSAIITSDGVFDYLLDVRALNEGLNDRREALIREYFDTREHEGTPMRSLADYEELKRLNEVRKGTVSQYVTKRLHEKTDLEGRSNGESAFHYFTEKIKDNALYLLDEPENSLSASLQAELARFLEDSARFYHCQLVISTHSPFLLSIKGAKIYDLDSRPVKAKKWYELENMRAYYELFMRHANAFDSDYNR